VALDPGADGRDRTGATLGLRGRTAASPQAPRPLALLVAALLLLDAVLGGLWLRWRREERALAAALTPAERARVDAWAAGRDGTRAAARPAVDAD
jgi:hypothetical protein